VPSIDKGPYISRAPKMTSLSLGGHNSLSSLIGVDLPQPDRLTTAMNLTGYTLTLSPSDANVLPAAS